MALNVNALVNTPCWPLTPWEAVGCVREDREVCVGPPLPPEGDQLKSISRSDQGMKYPRRDGSDKDNYNDSKIWLRLLDTY